MDGHGTPYIGLVAMSPKIEQFKDMARQARRDLFDQSHPIGRLSLLQCAMLGGGTVVTISLAGSLFFSISPNAADHKILLYLLFTLAPFAIVSPLLGPLIDRSRGARRLMVVSAAVGQVVLCPLMATHLHSLLLFPLAFLVLVCQKLYLVTKGALVPEMAALDGSDSESEQAGYATLNARLTLLGTLAGFVASVPAVILYKVAGSPAVLVFAMIVFVAAAVAGARLPVLTSRRAEEMWTDQSTKVREYGQEGEALTREQDLLRLQPFANPEVMLGLSAMCIVRGLTGFMTFMLAFGLRRMHGVGLYWYGLVLAGSGAGAIVGLVLVGRLRKRMTEQQLLLVLPLAHRHHGGRLRRLGHALGAGGPRLHGRPVRFGGPTVIRRHDPALHPPVRPGSCLRPLRHAPAAGVGRGLAHPPDHRLHPPAGRRHHGRAGRARRSVLRDGTARRPRAAHGAWGLPRDRAGPGASAGAGGPDAQPRRSPSVFGLIGQGPGEAVAELGVVLLNEGHLRPPALGVDPQELFHLLPADVEARGVDGLGCGDRADRRVDGLGLFRPG